MITVNVIKENRKYKKITILGHAMYDDYGKDIVCSACSSIVITTVNAIERIDKDSISYIENPFTLKTIKNNDITLMPLLNISSSFSKCEMIVSLI